MYNDFVLILTKDEIETFLKRNPVLGLHNIYRIISGATTYIPDTQETLKLNLVRENQFFKNPMGRYPAPRDHLDALAYSLGYMGRRNGKQIVQNLADLQERIDNACHYTPKKIIQNGPAFIVFWNDGTKTILKRKEDDQDDPYAAFGQALMIKIYGTNSAARRMIDKHYFNQNLDISNKNMETISKGLFSTKELIDNFAEGMKQFISHNPPKIKED